MSPDSSWLKQFPLKALIEKGWVPQFDSPAEQLRALLNFFGVAGIKEWKAIWTAPEVAYPQIHRLRSQSHGRSRLAPPGRTPRSANPNRACTTRTVFIKALYDIRRLTILTAEDFVPKASELCRSSGVALVFVPELPATRAYGATRWLTPTKAMLQLSLRGKKDDFLWFTFFHESAHILKHGKRDVFIEAKDGTSDEETLRKEHEANTFASEFLIPKHKLAAFRQYGRLSAQSIERFATELGIAPGIVVGRLQHEGLLPYTHLNALKQTFGFKEEAA